MAEILVCAVARYTHPDPAKDRAGCLKPGMPAVVMPDGNPWGKEEGPPRFVVVKVPGVPVSSLLKYVDVEPDAFVPKFVYRVRRWIIRWDDLPQKAKNRLKNDGELVIAAGGYTGPSDYTWAQVRSFFRDQMSGLDETGDL